MSRSLPEWRGAVAFAIVALALGTLPVPLALSLAPAGDLSATAPGVHLPSWFFGAVWMVINPCLGVASWLVWKRRAQPGATEALALFGVAFLLFLAFLPITAAAHDQRVTAMMDILGLVYAYVAAWVYSGVDAKTIRWMLPLLVWMPITALLKFVTLG